MLATEVSHRGGASERRIEVLPAVVHFACKTLVLEHVEVFPHSVDYCCWHLKFLNLKNCSSNVNDNENASVRKAVLRNKPFLRFNSMPSTISRQGHKA